jgi:benzoyl-CoA 2,3-epoxidase subunit A
MNMPAELLRQHLIDPEICIRCNTCEESCTRGAITHDVQNYVVHADQCNACMDCVANCPTGAVDSWRLVPLARAYRVEEQYQWTQLPPQDPLIRGADESAGAAPPARAGAPASAATPALNLFHADAPALATVIDNRRLTAADSSSEIRHVVLDFGSQHFPVLEGQSIGIVAPGVDANGRPHAMRVYSVASPRTGENGRSNTVALTVKRTSEDRDGTPLHGVCSNYLCDLAPGAPVRVVGPFGANFLMPEDPSTSLVMISTGTGIAPMRAMIQRRQSHHAPHPAGMVLFYGGRTPQELPYHDELQGLAQGAVDLNIAFSRQPGVPKTYVQDLLRLRSPDLVRWLEADSTYIYVCGLKGMEDGILAAFEQACRDSGLDWPQIQARLKSLARLHIETY